MPWRHKSARHASRRLRMRAVESTSSNRRRSSRPLGPGILRSSTVSCGRSLFCRASAATPLSASRTFAPVSAQSCFRPARIIAWSSTIRIFISRIPPLARGRSLLQAWCRHLDADSTAFRHSTWRAFRAYLLVPFRRCRAQRSLCHRPRPGCGLRHREPQCQSRLSWPRRAARHSSNLPKSSGRSWHRFQR